MNGNAMHYPQSWRDFLEIYSFKDKDEVYTNGAMLVPVFRVSQMVEHYFHELNPDGLPCGLTVSGDGKMLNWRGENYVRQSVMTDEVECEDVSTKYGLFVCSRCGCRVEEDGVDFGGINFCPDCGKVVNR